MNKKVKYAAFLRGVNVGGHHKVPMSDLRRELEFLGCGNVKTLLNSGNAVFESDEKNPELLQSKIEKHLEIIFGFPVPVLLRNIKEIKDAVESAPFAHINVTKDTRLYVSFLKLEPERRIKLPLQIGEGAYRILEIKNRIIFSVLDLSVTQTTKGMEELERLFGKEITTRNWNTILKLVEL